MKIKLFREITLTLCFCHLFFAFSYSNVDTTLKENSSVLISKNEIGMEIGGDNIVYALFFEKIFWQKKNIRFGVRIGTGVWPYPYTQYNPDNGETKMFYKPAWGSYITPSLSFHKRKHAWQFGIGVSHTLEFARNVPLTYYSTTYIGDDHLQRLFLVGSIGYKRYIGSNGWYLKPSLLCVYLLGIRSSNPLYLYSPENRFLPWAGLSVGYSIKRKKV